MIPLTDKMPCFRCINEDYCQKDVNQKPYLEKQIKKYNLIICPGYKPKGE